MFAALQMWRSRRARAVATLGVAVVWLTMAMLVLIPLSRRHDGMSGGNQFATARYADGGQQELAIQPLVARVFNGHALETTFNAVAAFGLLPLGAPTTLLVTLPGLLVDLAAREETRQAWLSDHYFWPFIPWLALATVLVLTRVERRSRSIGRGVAMALIAVTALDSPLIRAIPEGFVPDPAAARVRAQLPRRLDGFVIAQPNLLPHLPHTMTAATADPAQTPTTRRGLILLTTAGDTWPFSQAEIARAVQSLNGDPDVASANRDSLYMFIVDADDSRPQY
jgi:hypothetical protein